MIPWHTFFETFGSYLKKVLKGEINALHGFRFSLSKEFNVRKNISY